MAAPTSCNPCAGCIPGNMNNGWFKQAVIILLCEIAAAVDPDPPSGSEIVPLTAVIKLGSDATNAYVAIGLLDAEEKLSHLNITNNTDGEYAISLDGTTEFARVLANTQVVVDFSGKNVSAVDVSWKYTTAPGVGLAGQPVIFDKAYYYG